MSSSTWRKRTEYSENNSAANASCSPTVSAGGSRPKPNPLAEKLSGVLSQQRIFHRRGAQLTRSGLVRYLVLFIIELETRRIEIAGIAPDPDGQWMKQIARNLTDVQDGALTGVGYLIHDRDPLFTHAFCEILRSNGVTTVKLPARSPNLNAYAERFFRTIKSECLSQVIPIGERHLRNVVNEFTEHYHLERNHQGLNNWLTHASQVRPLLLASAPPLISQALTRSRASRRFF
jgi:transposase InsO family protein